MINGGSGAGTDRLDYSTTITAVSVNLTLGIATKMSGFQGIESLIGGTGETTSDTLIGPNLASTWNLTGGKTGNVNGDFAFAGVENLTGGTSADVFSVTDSADSFGTINGGSGTGIVDILDYSLVTGPIGVTMPGTASKLTSFTGVESLIGSGSAQDSLMGANAANTWNVTGVDQGTIGSTSFSSFENLTGGTLVDTFTLKSAESAIRGRIDGNSGADRLVGFNVSNTWDLTGIGTGSLNVQNFAAIENLTGGTDRDSFIFQDSADGFGVIAGGTGIDTLDFSALAGPITVDLKTMAAPKLTTFSAIEALVGSDSTADTLAGANATQQLDPDGDQHGHCGHHQFQLFRKPDGRPADRPVHVEGRKCRCERHNRWWCQRRSTGRRRL